MEKYERPKSSLASHRRRFEPLDMNKSSSSLNVSTSSLRSTSEGTRKDEAAVQVTRRTTTVRFAPPTKSSSSAAAALTKTPSSLVSGHKAMARPDTASGPRPGSSAGPRCGTSAGRLSQSGVKAMRRSWGFTGAIDAKEEKRNDTSASKTQQIRSSSAPRRILRPEEKEKPSPKRGSKIMMTTSRTKNQESSLKSDKAGSRSPPNIAKETVDNQKAPKIVSLNSAISKVSLPGRITAAMIGASWESLPSDVQSLGLDVMRYRDYAEAAAVEALQEASAAEILLRCLSAFAELTSTAAEQSPQQTVDEFLALHAEMITISTTAVRGDDKQGRPADDWLRAAVATDLAPFCLYSATRQSGGTSSPVAASQSPPLARRPAATAGGHGAEDATWVDAARRGLGEQMRAWFLGHVERLLDGDVAGTLGQLKRVSDWLDAAGLDSESSEAVERVRKKIYGFLLDHVESAVVALNGGAAPGRRK